MINRKAAWDRNQLITVMMCMCFWSNRCCFFFTLFQGLPPADKKVGTCALGTKTKTAMATVTQTEMAQTFWFRPIGAQPSSGSQIRFILFTSSLFVSFCSNQNAHSPEVSLTRVDTCRIWLFRYTGSSDLS